MHVNDLDSTVENLTQTAKTAALYTTTLEAIEPPKNHITNYLQTLNKMKKNYFRHKYQKSFNLFYDD